MKKVIDIICDRMKIRKKEIKRIIYMRDKKKIHQ